ncbi:hypothetical protein H2200_004815 [Cladophialophora chaetospira]|uniref:Alcohol dehydrogenase n=1 Tax=Cladophialophora chaetospira TaxID=386627 RepID=A0AA38XDT2_9EURO|nr:hypothetical protein H2200_004815 [Cladophialophora chaetospira]
MSEMGLSCAGHEGAGVIVKIGDSVKSCKVGQRAAYGPIHSTCGLCQYCKTGKETYCQQAVFTGGTVDGTYRQYCAVPETFIHLIPEGVSDYVAGPAMCSAGTMYSSLKESGLRAGDWAVFPGGGGGTGIQGVQLACAMGIRPLVVDTGTARRTLALGLGAECFVDFLTERDPVKRVLEITDGGAHGVFVSAVQSYPVSLDYLGSRPGGVVMCIGLPPKGKYHIDTDPTRLCLRNQSIKGTLSSSRIDIAETLEFARRGKLHLEPTVVGMGEFNEAVQRLKNGQVAGRMVSICVPGAEPSLLNIEFPKDLRSICFKYAACLSERKFNSLPEFVHDDVIYNSKAPMTAKDFGSMIDGLIQDFLDFRLDVELLVTEPHGDPSNLNGMVSARFRLSYESQKKESVKDRVVFYEHVFFQFEQGKIAEIWPMIAWPDK